MKPLLTLVLLFGLLLAAGVWFLAPRTTSAPVALPPSPTPAASEVAAALEGQAPLPQHAPAAPPTRPVSARPDPIVGPKATLEVLCVRASDHRAVAGLAVEVRGGSEDRRITDEYFPPVGDENGRITLEVPAQSGLRVALLRSLTSARAKPVPCAALAEGEHRLVELAIELPGDTHLSGQVTDARDGEVLVGVEVSSAGNSQHEYLATTGNDGRFEIADTSWAPTQLLLEKQGYVARRVRLEPEAKLAQAEHAFTLARGATLQGFLLDAQGEPVQMGSVRVWTGTGFEARSFCDAKGWYSMDGLAPGEEYQVDIERWRRRVVEADPLAPLEPGETRRLDLRLPAPMILAGIVLDEDQKPYAGLELALARVPKSGIACFDPSLEPEETVLTDFEGRFRFVSARAGEWAVGPTTSSRSPIPLVPSLVSLPQTGDQPLVLQVLRRARLQGRVVDAAGKPAGVVQLSVRLEGCRNAGWATTKADGSFDVPVRGPWAYLVKARSRSGAADSPEVEARAGGGETVLQLGGSSWLEVHLAGATREAWLAGASETASTPGTSFRVAFDESGKASLDLAPGSYRLLAHVGGSWSHPRTVKLEVGATTLVGELALEPTAFVDLDASAYSSNVHVVLALEGIQVGEYVLDPLKPRSFPAPPGAIAIAHGETRHTIVTTRSGEHARVVLVP
ncbi:MAG: hypothetical protein IPJ19_07375 [Planctomycetes bacterium]|nr:hypothetical protein [Planctomycetota bacterium]